MLCVECGEKMRRSNAPIIQKYKGAEVTVRDIPHWECPGCGEVAFDSADLKAFEKELDRAYREANGLLAPDKIKAIREQLGLSQSQFEDALGVHAPTASRWETGWAVQSRTADLLMRMAAKYPCVARDLLDRSEVRPLTGISFGYCEVINRENGSDVAGREVSYVEGE